MKEFGELLSEAMDDTIRDVFGESASELIHRLLERQVLLRREEVGEKIEVVYACLERLVGSEGARVIQATGLRRLCLKLRREYEEVEVYFALLDELYEVKFKLLSQCPKEEHPVCN